MADIQRDESFRSAIKNQKRRLSATKIEKKNTLHAPDGVKAPPKIGLLGKGKGEKEGNFLLGRDYWTPPGSNRSTPVRALDGSSDLDTAPTTGSNPDIRLEFWDIAELSPLSTPATPGACVSPEPEEPVVNIPINKSQDGHSLDGEALRKVVNMIKDIEFQGFAVPERITIKI
ncbi:uncharacterized protein LOC111708910 [Eurytemora carolleeae]|uniref:uncharacterized protein LOC111708910 n=1 Tax=Eurytemora carolleeae TaxID=1294199 RepID=UPI000C772C48|nr:uncharacterized protein LOC111708910 [Eurytemora carolleeae]|eukprot:XP_023338184.1 uncharacterized protein LOC111708910 [Eurytemora affinis]